jgi:hypothetical protein
VLGEGKLCRAGRNKRGKTSSWRYGVGIIRRQARMNINISTIPPTLLVGPDFLLLMH